MNVFWSEFIRGWTYAWQTAPFMLGVFSALVIIVGLLFVSLRILTMLAHVKNVWTTSSTHPPTKT